MKIFNRLVRSSPRDDIGQNSIDAALMLQDWRSKTTNIFLGVLFLTVSVFVIEITINPLETNTLAATYGLFCFWLILLAMLVFRKIPHWIRTSLILAAGYSVSIISLTTFGPTSVSLHGYILSIPMVALILIGKRAGIIATAASTLISISCFILLSQESIRTFSVYSPVNFFVSIVSFLFVIMSLLLLFYRFQERLLEKQRRTQEELVKAHGLLAAQNLSLEQKVAERTDELEQRNRTLSVLYEISEAATLSRDAYYFYASIHQIIAGLIAGENFFIALYDEISGMVSFPYFVDEKDPTPPSQPLKGNYNLTEYVIHTGNSLSIRKGQIENPEPDREIQQSGTKIEAGIGVPLKVIDKVMGAIFITSYYKEIDYTKEDEKALAFIAQHIATALVRFSAQESERQRTIELDIINSVQSGLAAELDSQSIIELVGSKLYEKFGLLNFVLTWYDEKENLVYFPYAYEQGERLVVPPRPPLPGGIFERLKNNYKDGTLLYGENKRLVETVISGTRSCKSGFAVPVISSNRFLGAIQVESYEGERDFNESEIHVMATIASSLGNALEKVELSGQRNEAVEALRQNEEKFRKIVNTLPQEIQILDLNMVATYVSPSVYRYTGYTQEERLSQRVEDYLPPEMVTKLRNILSDALAQEDTQERDMDRVVTVDMEVKHKDGHPIIMQSNFTFLRDFEGKPTGILAITTDITERKHTEQAIIESERRLADIINFLPIATMVIDTGGRVTAWNHAMEELTSVKAEKILGKGNFEYSLPFYGERAPTLIDFLNLPQDELKLKYKHVEHHGNILTAETFANNLGNNGKVLLGFASFLYDGNGKIIGAIESVRDVTNLRQAEADSQKAKEAAEAANRSKSVFLANMSHEIRTPMNAILGFAQLMQRDEELSKQQREHLDIINRSGEHLLALINDILELSKIEAGRLILIPNTFDLYKLLDDLGMMFGIRAKDKKLRMTVEKVSEVPNWITTDEGKLRQVLINLIGNAVKFTEEGGVGLRAGIMAGQAGKNLLVFEVEDTGPGISSQEIGRLFIAFEQVSSGIKSGGTGLGLALSKGLIQFIGGTIDVTSTLGKGSIFRFSIPFDPGQEPLDGQKVINQRIVGLKPGQGEIRVLIADDRETNRLLLLQLLTKTGFCVKEATNGAETLTVFQDWKPQIILMDMGMPIMDGYEATRLLKSSEEGKKCTVIAVTASAFQEDRKRVMDNGADGYLSKPFKETDLFEIIHQLTGVNYEYEAEKESSQILKPIEMDNFEWQQAVTALPVDLIYQCRNAANNADIMLLKGLLAEMSNINPEVGQRLNNLAGRYAYDEIIDLLNKGE